MAGRRKGRQTRHPNAVNDVGDKMNADVGTRFDTYLHLTVYLNRLFVPVDNFPLES